MSGAHLVGGTTTVSCLSKLSPKVELLYVLQIGVGGKVLGASIQQSAMKELFQKIYQKIIGDSGRLPKFLSFRHTNDSYFIAFLRKNFRNFPKVGVLGLAIFFSTNFQNFQTKFLNTFQNRKNYHFSTLNSSKSPCLSKLGQLFS